MSRGGRSQGNLRLRSGEAFRLRPVAWARHFGPGHPGHSHDLTPDVVGALLDASATTIHTWATTGRTRSDGTIVRLRSWLPYGKKPHSRRYYALADVEQFAAEAWMRPRPLQYELIPMWYLRKHGRLDLAGGVATEPARPLKPGEVLLPPEEQEAVDLGWPRGSYVEHHSRGISVWSPQGVLLNPDESDSAEAHAAATRELEWMRAQG